MAPYQATTELDDELIISIRCVGGGKHRKHAGQWVPRTRVEEHCLKRFKNCYDRRSISL